MPPDQPGPVNERISGVPSSRIRSPTRMIPAQEDHADELDVSHHSCIDGRRIVPSRRHRRTGEWTPQRQTPTPPVLLPRHRSRPSRSRTCHRNRQPAQDLAKPELIKASRKSRGHYGPTPAYSGSPTRGSLHDKPNSLCNLCRPTATYVHVGFDRAESEADLHRYAEARHDNHADAHAQS